MHLTIVIQHGDTGPIRIATTTTGYAEQDLVHWQGGSPHPIRVRAIPDQDPAELRAQLVEHRITGDWFHPDALPHITDAGGILAGRLDQAHQQRETERHRALRMETVTQLGRNARTR